MRRNRILPLLALAACLLTLRCTESVQTRLEIEYPFTIWGLINPKADTHVVRVFEIENTIRLIRPDPIDARVTSTRLQTGETVAWRDSVIQLPDGDYRHAYWAAFPAAEGETYRLDVTRSDGSTSSAETTVPPAVSLEIIEADSNHTDVIQSIFIRGNPPTLPRIDVEYFLVGFRTGTNTPIENPITFSYANRAERRPGGWLLDLTLGEDFRIIFQEFEENGEVSTALIQLRDIEVRVHVGDEKWVSPSGSFDAEALVEPGVFTNVTNGFGYFGAGYVEAIRFQPPTFLITRAGFD